MRKGRRVVVPSIFYLKLAQDGSGPIKVSNWAGRPASFVHSLKYVSLACQPKPK